GLSAHFTVNVAEPSQLVIVQQPSDVIAGRSISPGVSARVEDFFGNGVPGASVDVSLQSGSGVLNGTTTHVTDANGLAVFNGLSIDQIGTKVLRIISGTLVAVDTSSFEVTP